MVNTGLEQHIEKLIVPAIESLGYEVVRVQFGQGSIPVLQIMADCKETDGTFNVDDCAKISRTVSAILDVEDPIPGEYNLEVSSPGIDRPLVRLSDFEKYAGRKTKITTKEPVEGQKRFTGMLLGVSEDTVLMNMSESGGSSRISIPFCVILSAKLVLTDELIKEAQKKQKQLSKQQS